MHIRRGDFKNVNWNDVVISNDKIIINNNKHLVNNTLLLITDEYDNDLIMKLKKICKRVICLSDINNNIIYDMLLCTASKQFIGTPYSSFSRQIVKFRKIINPSIDINYITPVNTKNIPWWGKY